MLTDPGLAVFQSLWAMENLPRAADPWPLAHQCKLLANAGFDGLAVDLGARPPAAEVVAPLTRDHELQTAVFAFIRDDAGLADALTYAERIEARRMVICAQIYGFEPAPLAATLRRWHRSAADAGVTLQVETHRNTATNDLRFTVALLDHLDPQIELAGDLSHFVCANELPDTPTDEYEDLIATVLNRCGSLQGRIATRGQIQVPLGTPAGRHWEARFRDWWHAGFASILARQATRSDSAPIMFCTELGTSPYAITGVDGIELSDRWAEARILKRWATEAFQSAQQSLEGSHR